MFSFWITQSCNCPSYKTHMDISYAPFLDCQTTFNIFNTVASRFAYQNGLPFIQGKWITDIYCPLWTATYLRKMDCRNWKGLGWATWRHNVMVFCKVSMAIPLFTSLLSSRMLRCIQTLFIDVSNTELSSNESGWLLHDSTSGDTCFITVAPNSRYFHQTWLLRR